MKTCPYCGKALHPQAAYCDGCGNAVMILVPVVDQRKAALDSMYRFMKYERLAHKIEGIVMLILGSYCLLMMLLFAPFFMEIIEQDYAFICSVIQLAFYGPFSVASGIVSLCMRGKAGRLMNSLYTNPAPAIKRCGSVGTIVLSGIFNQIAIIFIIINFVNTKRNRAVLEQYINHY